MPVANITAARDAIYGQLKAVLDASDYADVPVFYPDAVKPKYPDHDPHIRVFTDHTMERQKTLGGPGQRRYRVHGIFTAQIFTPAGDGQKTSDLISGVVKGAFRGVSVGLDAIEFRNVRVVDVGNAEAFQQTNVQAEFEYDEIA